MKPLRFDPTVRHSIRRDEYRIYRIDDALDIVVIEAVVPRSTICRRRCRAAIRECCIVADLRGKLAAKMRVSAAVYDEAIAGGSDAIADALVLESDRPVPSCPGWDLAELAGHVGSLYERVGEQVRRRSPEPFRPSDLSAPPVGPARAGWLCEASRGLIEALAGAEDDAPAGRWRDRAVTAGFWRRRMAHETVVHRVDVEDALGRAVVLEGDLAADGIDEVIELFVPFSTRKDGWPPGGPLCLVRGDGSEQWWVDPGADRVELRRQPPDGLQPGSFARVEAPAAELFLVCWGRRVPAPAAVTGNAALLDRWVSLFGW